MSGRPTRISPLGDAAVLADMGGDVEGAQRLARLVAVARDDGRWPWVQEVVIGFGTVTVLSGSTPADMGALCAELGHLAASAASGTGVGEPSGPSSGPPSSDRLGTLEIPVHFDGPDLAEMSRRLGRPSAEVVAELVACELRVAFLGFSPGFGYLVGLPPDLATVPRRDRPRPAVPAGSVALGGGFAAVYPQPTPGGWNLVGRTSTVLFDPEHPPYARLTAGQRVRLIPCQDRLVPPPARDRVALGAGGATALVVEGTGLCSLVEDAGRQGVAELGVPGAGAADLLGLGLANRLVGNPDGAAAVEVTGRGPRLRATAALHVAVIGDLGRPGLVDVRVDGRPVPEGEVVPVSAGQVLEVGDVATVARALLAVAGGLATPVVLGSRSSDLLCGLGPGPLRHRDELALGPPGRPRARLRFPSSGGGGAGAGSAGAPTTLRVLPGPDLEPELPLGAAAARTAAALAGEWRVGPDSNRVGLRLARADGAAGAGDARSVGWVPPRGMVTGAVQSPPGGELVILGPDHATVGGYPVLAVVCSADLFRLAHLPPGAAVRFDVVDHDQAVAFLLRRAAAIDGAVEGWYPTRTG